MSRSERSLTHVPERKRKTMLRNVIMRQSIIFSLGRLNGEDREPDLHEGVWEAYFCSIDGAIAGCLDER